MMRVAIDTAFPGHAQAQLAGGLCAPHVVTITESRPGEADEPRHFIRRAIAVLKAGGTTSQNKTEKVLKAQALLALAFKRAQVIRSWSSSKNYDPLPDLRELQKVSKARLQQGSGAANLNAAFLECLDGCIGDLLEASPAQRMGIA